ncbi:hypothetical protein M408DRAFT_331896 [Serendipita vermifera MAFF 305830]|uniref:Uncharacterized protein n=1 Tax=Serendipita vermifera MAFF 305830 TaxID=933852 RepID=A0A0C3AY43_SERVB|nr:hypothetical protein M408DRAFT_331896 [Serendipita vermifera MAFF 305830]
MRFHPVILLSLLGGASAYVTICQTYATTCDSTTAAEAIANLKLYLDNFGAQPAGANFYLWTGIVAGSSNYGTCGVQLKSDAYHPGNVQANVTKTVFNQATLAVTYNCIYQGKQGSAALNDTTRYEGPTFTFW